MTTQQLSAPPPFAQYMQGLAPGHVGHFYDKAPLEVGAVVTIEGTNTSFRVLECIPRPQDTFYIAYEIPAEVPIPFGTGKEAGAAVMAIVEKLRISDIYTKRYDSSRHVAIAINHLEEAWLRLQFAAPGGLDSTGKEVKP